MFDSLSFFSKIHLASNLSKRSQERYDYVACMAQEQQENTELHDALSKNQSMEQEQMETVIKDQEQQKIIEQDIQKSVRYPKEEAFQRKMKNAEGYVRRLMTQSEIRKEIDKRIRADIEAVIWRENHAISPDLPKDVKNARTYWRQRLIAGRERA